MLENAAGVPAGTIIRGKIDRGFDEICIIYQIPASVCSNAAGIYRLKVKDGAMETEVVREDCPARAAQFDHSWKLVSATPKSLPGGK